MRSTAGGSAKGTIGFSSCCFPTSTPFEEILQFGLDHRFGAFEIEINATNFDPARVPPSTLQSIRDLSGSGRVRFSVHSPGNVNFSDPDPSIRARSEQDVLGALELASQLGAETVVVHPGRVAGEFSPEAWQDAVECNISALKRCAARAGALGVSLSVENLCHEKGSVNPNIDHFFEMCRAIGLSSIGITLDTNHAGLVDGLHRSVEVVGPYVNHVHFSSNKGVKSDHCEPAAGVMEFQGERSFFKELPGLNIIELNEAGDESAGALLRTQAYLEDLISSSKDVS
jgi:sugar phosphate isomerase/epimerase